MKNINYKGFWSMLALMFGFTIFSASMLTGGQIQVGLKTYQIILAMIFGNSFLAIYGAFMAYVSHRRKMQLDSLAEVVFGKNGSYIVSLIMTLSQIGWFGVGVAMIAIPMEEVTGVSKWLFVFLAAMAMMSTAFFGMKSLTIISLLAVPLVLIIGFTSVGIGVASHHAISAKNSTLTVVGAISLIISTFISGATFVPNFATNASTTKIAVWTTGLAFLVGNGVMIGFGIAGSALYGDGNLVEVMIKHQVGLAVPGLIMLILNIWTTNDSGLYSISAAIQKKLKIPKKASVIIVGLVGAGASIWLFDNFINFLSTMNIFIPGFGIIFIIDYFARRYQYKFIYGFNIEALASWALGAGLAFIPSLKEYAPIVTVSITGVTYGACVFAHNLLGNKFDLPKLVFGGEHVVTEELIA